ncbi:MAG: agmatine deiminase family protein [Alphaproteobacteria bacterium]|nr:agmatine deiminase family protein [Alphaproteobacteria bacterium]
MQWPGPYEKSYETAFARIANVIADYEKLHILHSGPAILESAKRVITREGGDPDHPNIAWHAVASDSAWMRDNGPVRVMENGTLTIQDWRFDAWGQPGVKRSPMPLMTGSRLRLPASPEHPTSPWPSCMSVAISNSTAGIPSCSTGA